MGVNFTLNKKWIIIGCQLLFFITIILPALTLLLNPIVIPVFFALEITLFILVLNKKSFRLFFLIWQLQLFLLVLFILFFNPQFIIPRETIAPETILSLLFIVVFIETLLLLYIIFQEKAVTKILFILSISTMIIVFLIVIFISKEGYPAFQENNPVDFLTGTTWQPSYVDSTNDSIELTTSIRPYEFEVKTLGEKFFIPLNTSYNLTIQLKNTGGNADIIYISCSSEIYSNITPSSISLDPQQQENCTITIYTTESKTFPIEITAVSQTTNQTKKSIITVSGTPVAFSLYPNSYDLNEHMDNLGSQHAVFTITNYGMTTENYIIAVHAPSYFIPIVFNIDSSWDYENNTGFISLIPGESKSFTLNPRLSTLIDNHYQINISVSPTLHPHYQLNATIYFHFKQKTYITATPTALFVKPSGTAIYTIYVPTTQGINHTLTIHQSSPLWSSSLYSQNKSILQRQGTIRLNSTLSGFTTLQLQIHAPAENYSDPLITSLTITIGGTKPEFGILPFILGTLLTSSIAIIIAVPLGLGCAIFLAEYCPKRIRTFLRPLYELLAGIPSVIYGLWGFLTLGPFLSSYIYPSITNTLGVSIGFLGSTGNMAESIMTAAIVLGIMIIPIIITLSEDSIRSVHKELKEGSLALGTTRWQTIRHVILPVAKSGIITAIILALGRAIGETMAVTMIMGAHFSMPTSLFGPTGTMPSVIALTLPWAFTYPLTIHALFAIATILFLMIFCLNIFIFRMQNSKQTRKTSTFSKNPLSKLFSKKITYSHQSTPLLKNTQETKEFIIVEIVKEDKSKKTPILKKFLTKPSTIKKQKTNHSSTKEIKQEKAIIIFIVIAALLVTTFLFFIIGDVIIRGGLALKPEFFFQEEQAGGRQGGFVNAILGSLQLVGIAILFAAPLAIGAAIYVQEYVKKNNIITKIILFTSDTLASTPSIVFGAFGFMFFVLFLRYNYSVLAGGLTLGIMIIPLLLRSSIEAIKAIPRDYQEGAIALGATKWQSIRTVILPPASPMITSGAIISIGRAIGETAAVIFTAGYTAHIATSLFDSTASMPNMIYKYFDLSATWPELAAKVYAVAFVLIIVVLLLNSISKLVSHRASRMMKH